MKTSTSTSFVTDTWVYLRRIQTFQKQDWIVYTVWIGLMMGLLLSVSGFLFVGWTHAVAYPDYLWNLPLGTLIFVAAIAFDTIGHRTVYKEVLQKGEALVHHITIFAGITSVLALCLAYEHPVVMKIPALVLTVLSFVYSLIDEGLHWHRYLTRNSDRVEMWSHFFILTGHLMMMLSWWQWYLDGYPGVAQTLLFLKG